MSPTISAVPAMQPNTFGEASSAGTSLATGTPFLVITTGSRRARTSSRTRRQCYLNCPAGIVFMVPSKCLWSQPKNLWPGAFAVPH